MLASRFDCCYLLLVACSLIFCHLVQAMADFLQPQNVWWLKISFVTANMTSRFGSQVRHLPCTRQPRVPPRMVVTLVLMWAKLVGEVGSIIQSMGYGQQ